MRELRMIVFQDAEVTTALVEYKMRAKASLPPGTILGIDKAFSGGVEVILKITSDDGAKHKVAFPPQETAAALIAYLLQRNVRMPKKSEKVISLVGSDVVLQLDIGHEVSMLTKVKQKLRFSSTH